MKKALIKIVFLLFSTSVLAQEITCLDKLLPYSRHSGLHQISKEEWNYDNEPLDGAGAMLAFKALVIGKLLCVPGEVKVKVDPICQPVIKDITQSNVCFLFTNIGYFFVTRDNGKNTNFIFSRDKKFSELQ